MDKNYKLLTFYQEKNFTQVNKLLYNQFFIYIIILLGFTIMSISFLQGFNDLTASKTNLFILGFILTPIIYLMVKSIYGLILLQNAYQIFHYYLINEYCILYIIGYNILLMSFSLDYLIYSYESIILVCIGILFRTFKNKIILFVLLAATGISYYLLNPYFIINPLLVFGTMLFTLLVVRPIVFKVNKQELIKEEIMFIQLGIKNHPKGKIKDYVKYE